MRGLCLGRIGPIWVSYHLKLNTTQAHSTKNSQAHVIKTVASLTFKPCSNSRSLLVHSCPLAHLIPKTIPWCVRIRVSPLNLNPITAQSEFFGPITASTPAHSHSNKNPLNLKPFKANLWTNQRFFKIIS